MEPDPRNYRTAGRDEKAGETVNPRWDPRIGYVVDLHERLVDDDWDRCRMRAEAKLRLYREMDERVQKCDEYAAALRKLAAVLRHAGYAGPATVLWDQVRDIFPAELVEVAP